MTTKEKVTFKYREHEVAGELYKPAGFNAKTKYAAITVAHPGEGSKNKLQGFMLNIYQKMDLLFLHLMHHIKEKVEDYPDILKIPA